MNWSETDDTLRVKLPGQGLSSHRGGRGEQRCGKDTLVLAALHSAPSGHICNYRPPVNVPGGAHACYPLLCPQQGARSLARGRHLLKQNNLKWKSGDLHSGLSWRKEWRSMEEDSGSMMTPTLLPSPPCSVLACLLLSSRWLLRAVGSWPSNAEY